MGKNYSFLRFPGFKYRALTFSFDDGMVEDVWLVNLFKQYGLKGTFNLNSCALDITEDAIPNHVGRQRLSKSQLVELFKDSGMEVAVHGVNHLSLAEMPQTVMIRDVLDDRMRLEDAFGTIIDGMAYANGSLSDEVVDVLKICGIKYARTVVSTLKFDIPQDWLRMPATCHYRNDKLMELADAFLSDYPSDLHYIKRLPRLFYVWGHSYEFRETNTYEKMQAFAEKMGTCDSIWNATNIEVYNYVKAFDSLVYAANEKHVYNPSALDVYLCWFGKNVLIPAGQTVELPSR